MNSNTNLRARILAAKTEAITQANALSAHGFPEQAADHRAKARAFEQVLGWIDEAEATRASLSPQETQAALAAQRQAIEEQHLVKYVVDEFNDDEMPITVEFGIAMIQTGEGEVLLTRELRGKIEQALGESLVAHVEQPGQHALHYLMPASWLPAAAELAQGTAAEFYEQARDHLWHLHRHLESGDASNAAHERLDAINAQERAARAYALARSRMGMVDA